MEAVPATRPYTVVELPVGGLKYTPELVELQVPPALASLKDIVEPTQTADPPEMVPGIGLTKITLVTITPPTVV